MRGFGLRCMEVVVRTEHVLLSLVALRRNIASSKAHRKAQVQSLKTQLRELFREGMIGIAAELERMNETETRIREQLDDISYRVSIAKNTVEDSRKLELAMLDKVEESLAELRGSRDQVMKSLTATIEQRDAVKFERDFLTKVGGLIENGDVESLVGVSGSAVVSKWIPGCSIGIEETIHVYIENSMEVRRTEAEEERIKEDIERLRHVLMELVGQSWK